MSAAEREHLARCESSARCSTSRLGRNGRTSLGGRKLGAVTCLLLACCATSGAKSHGHPRADKGRQLPDRAKLADNGPTAVVEPCHAADAQRVVGMAVETNHVGCGIGPPAAVARGPFAYAWQRAERAQDDSRSVSPTTTPALKLRCTGSASKRGAVLSTLRFSMARTVP